MKINKDFSFKTTLSIFINKTTIIFKTINKLFFKKVTFDNVSKKTLENVPENGKTVFVSFQSTNTSLLILNSTLSKNNFKVPQVSLGFQCYFHKKVYLYCKYIIHGLKKIFTGSRKNNYQNEIALLFKEKNPLAISILSPKALYERYVKNEKDPLWLLVDLQMEQESPIYIFPQIMFWNMNPQRSRSFASTGATGDKGLFSALLTVLKSRTAPFIRITEPINLKNELEHISETDKHAITKSLRSKLFDIYHNEIRTVLGPIIQTKQEMAESVLFHSNTLTAIQNEIKEKNSSERKVRKKAFRYFSEIAADFSIVWIHYFKSFLYRFFFKKIFDGIHYEVESIKKIREAAPKGPLIVVPSHRSHMDYLLLSCIFYNEKIVPPHIIAGANLSFFPIGTIFRKSGAIFIRRSFKGLALYTTILKQYLKTLLHEKYSIEFFIEGGRTRTGKILPPKKGIMKYLIEAIDEGYNNDLVFLPITINYNRILEENSYHKELRGSTKKKESTSAFVKSRKLLKRKYGTVNVSFAPPVTLKELRKQIPAGANEIDTIGNIIVEKLNENVVVTTFALVTTALLISPEEGFSMDMLKENILLLGDYLTYTDRKFEHSISDTRQLDPQIDYVLNSYIQDSIISELEISDSDTQNSSAFNLHLLNASERIRISFYKNTIAHFLFPVSLTALSILATSDADSSNLEATAETYKRLSELCCHDIQFNNTPDVLRQGFETSLDYLKQRDMLTTEQENITLNKNKIRGLFSFAAIVADLFESYFLVLSVITDSTITTIDKRVLINETRKKGIKNFHLNNIKYQEAISTSNFMSCLELLKTKKLLSEEHKTKKLNLITIIDKPAIQELLQQVKSITNLLTIKNKLDS